MKLTPKLSHYEVTILIKRLVFHNGLYRVSNKPADIISSRFPGVSRRNYYHNPTEFAVLAVIWAGLLTREIIPILFTQIALFSTGDLVYDC